LEIELYGRTLERSAEGVTNGDVDLGAVECTIARVDLPFAWILLIECFGELLCVRDDKRVALLVRFEEKHTSSAVFQVSMVPR
jgi:hypothetical protein